MIGKNKLFNNLKTNKIMELGTKEFNDSAMEMFGGKPNQQTAVEWLCEQYHLKQDIEIVKQAKQMEKQQQGYSEEVINDMFDTLKRNSVDNVATITNVDLFISSWKRELKNK